jgi:hypothetical protein
VGRLAEGEKITWLGYEVSNVLAHVAQTYH